ncbi:type I secretion system permease/ATPase [Aureimonas fodinaquatilis]|uniref:Type I secretion system permease/ATPase n=1 Tax=Aureimonas fodinaquatilis TaxID=2565783 RepID=A0A5B0DX76_9HYPH|nr:type I secretion system permease/ATPase [Aureimonas fodinaquatilis]KAA0970602.1 type I secretion system permease/ATPase [Aureimonas fodinaquatilis]
MKHEDKLVVASPKPASNANNWLEALRRVARHYELPSGYRTARPALTELTEQDRDIREMATSLGLNVKIVASLPAKAQGWSLPLIVELRDGRTGVVESISSSGMALIRFSGDEGLASPFPVLSLCSALSRAAIARPALAIPDARIDAYIQPFRPNWLRSIILSDMRPYTHVMLASFLANCLGLAGVIFSMQVYDRVVPAESYHTLYVLFLGVIVALLFDFILRCARMNVVDTLGKRADLRMSDLVFGHALRVRNDARPAATGTFISQLRDLEQVRELLTSTTVSAIADMPFFLLFLVIFWVIGGPLVAVPLVALVLLITPGILAQPRLRRFTSEAMRESALRNAILVEAVQGLEDIKCLQAEDRFQRRWNHCNAVTSQANLKLRGLANGLIAWTQVVQTGVFASVICLGAPMVISGEMTTGALIAASVLGSRMMAPMAQITQVLSRLQQAKVGLSGVNEIMKKPVDSPELESRVPLPEADGRYKFKSATFRYGDPTTPTVLHIGALTIGAGEKIALLGRNGAGKSTLLHALSGMMLPASGEVLLDDRSIGQIDPGDLRSQIGFASQNSRLFYGSIRENLLLGAPHASHADMHNAVSMVGADEFIARLPQGMDYPIQEGGAGLSGGQKQALLLARLLLRQPRIILLDEPTAAMDEISERHFIEHFSKWARGRTVIVATHRMRVLDLADRILVIERGRISLDDAKEKALASLRNVRNVATGMAERANASTVRMEG